jgi:hypothetical protein
VEHSDDACRCVSCGRGLTQIKGEAAATIAKSSRRSLWSDHREHAQRDNGHRGNSSDRASIVHFLKAFAKAGVQMIAQSELNSRAALCRKLAQREPANRTFWIAEAEIWSRLSKEKSRNDDIAKIDSGILARLRAQSAKCHGLTQE